MNDLNAAALANRIAERRRARIESAGLSLDDLTATVNGETVPAHVSGLGLDFPLVTAGTLRAEFAFGTILSALEYGRPLRF